MTGWPLFWLIMVSTFALAIIYAWVLDMLESWDD